MRELRELNPLNVLKLLDTDHGIEGHGFYCFQEGPPITDAEGAGVMYEYFPKSLRS